MSMRPQDMEEILRKLESLPAGSQFSALPSIKDTIQDPRKMLSGPSIGNSDSFYSGQVNPDNKMTPEFIKMVQDAGIIPPDRPTMASKMPEASGGMPPMLAQAVMGAPMPKDLGGAPAPTKAPVKPVAGLSSGEDPSSLAAKPLEAKSIFGEGLEEEDLDAAREEARRRRMAVGISEALSQGLATATGGKALDYSGTRESANAPVTDLKTKRKERVEGEARVTELDEKDPNSARNIAFRENLAKSPAMQGVPVPPNMTIAMAKGADFDIIKMNAAAKESERTRAADLKKEEVKVGAENARAAAKSGKDEKQLEGETFVKGVGRFPTKEDRQKFLENAATTIPALDGIENLKSYAKQGVAGNLNPVTRGQAEIDMNTLVGKLRIALTGPGPLTDAERAMIKDTIGNTTSLTSLDAVSLKKLEQLENTLKNSLKREAQVRGADTSYSPSSAKKQSATAYQDPEKEKRYQEWIKSQGKS